MFAALNEPQQQFLWNTTRQTAAVILYLNQNSASSDLRMQAHFTVSLRKLKRILKQVADRANEARGSGVSRWLFVGQISASIGFIFYSYQLHNWIFLFSNFAMLITAIVGEIIYISNLKAPASIRLGREPSNRWHQPQAMR
jgi:hypothetical protein